MRWAACAMLAMVGACAVGPDFVTPSAPVAPSWIEWRNKTLKTGDYEYRDWWRVFRDPVLDRLIGLAYQQNLTLLSAGTKVLQARALLGIAIGEFYPQQQQGMGLVTYNLRSRADQSTGAFASKDADFSRSSFDNVTAPC
jgi:outer membrane protein TolC